MSWRATFTTNHFHSENTCFLVQRGYCAEIFIGKLNFFSAHWMNLINSLSSFWDRLIWKFDGSSWPFMVLFLVKIISGKWKIDFLSVAIDNTLNRKWLWLLDKIDYRKIVKGISLQNNYNNLYHLYLFVMCLQLNQSSIFWSNKIYMSINITVVFCGKSLS